MLHVVEFVPVSSRWARPIMPAGADRGELVARARSDSPTAVRSALAGVGPASGRRRQRQAEILRVAGERAADLIVIGSRERHGMSVLVNLTEDTVLHAAPCDVLAVRVGVAR